MESGRDSKKWTFSLLDLFLLFLAVLQGTSQLFDFVLPAEDGSAPSLLKIWLALGNNISENWVAISVSLIFLVLACLMYRSLSHNSSSPNGGLKSIGLLLINLALCFKVYSVCSVSEKIAYLSEHLPAVAIISIIVLFVIAAILVIRQEYENAKEINQISQNPNQDPDSKASTEDDRTATDFHSDTQSGREMAFRLKHPFSYAYRSFVANIGKNREINREHKKQILQIKAETEKRKKDIEIENLRETGWIPESKGERVFGNLSALLAFFACIFLIVLLFTRCKDGASFQALQEIADYIFGLTNLLDGAAGPLTNFLLSSGVLFLLVILFLTFFLLIYISIRLVLYLLLHTAEDIDKIHRIGRAIKTFVLGVLDGAMRPLLFLPDFLECLETMLLDTDMDEKIDKMYPPTCQSPNPTETNPNGVSSETDLSGTGQTEKTGGFV